MPTTFLRLPAVMARTGLSRSGIYLKMSQGTFPRSYAIGPRTIAWREEDIDAWAASVLADTYKIDDGPAHARAGRAAKKAAQAQLTAVE